MRRRASAGVTTRVPNPSGAVTRTLPRNEPAASPTAASTASCTDSSIARARSATRRPISVNSQPTAPRSISLTPRIFSRARIRRETVCVVDAQIEGGRTPCSTTRDGDEVAKVVDPNLPDVDGALDLRRRRSSRSLSARWRVMPTDHEAVPYSPPDVHLVQICACLERFWSLTVLICAPHGGRDKSTQRLF